MDGFPVPQFYANRLFAELFYLLGFATPDPEGKSDYLLTDSGVDFFFENASASNKEMMTVLAEKVASYRKFQFENNTYGMGR